METAQTDNVMDNTLHANPAGGAWRVVVIDHHRNQQKGGHGVHLAFTGLPGVEICAVADSDEPSRLSLQQETNATRIYADWREMLEREKPHIVCVPSRLPGQHTEIVTTAARAGCHIYCEKPLALSLADADHMIAAADAANVRLAVAHLGRHAAVFQTARNMIRAGGIGRPLSVHCRGKEDHRGGGEDMLVLGSHLLDLCHFFFGDPQWVFAHVGVGGRDMLRTDSHEPTEPVGPVAGDDIVALYGFANNVRATFESRRDLHRAGELFRMGITITGTEATLAVRYDDERRLRIRKSGRPLEEGGEFQEIDTPWPDDPPGATPPLLPRSHSVGASRYYAHCNRHAALDLLRAIAENREPLSSGRDARWSLEMIHGVYVSHLAGRAIALPLTDRLHPLASVVS